MLGLVTIGADEHVPSVAKVLLQYQYQNECTKEGAAQVSNKNNTVQLSDILSMHSEKNNDDDDNNNNNNKTAHRINKLTQESAAFSGETETATTLSTHPMDSTFTIENGSSFGESRAGC